MKKLFPCFALFFTFLVSCEKEEAKDPYVPFVYTDSITDLEGNVYHTVTIGGQVWMAENLRSTRYNNGDSIEYLYYMTDWGQTDSGAYCNYNHNSEAESVYGHMYNFYVVNDPRGIAPPGWHVPTYYEWIGLMSYCGNADAANRLREFGYKHWLVDNEEATDEYGFAAIPGGYRDLQGDFYDMRAQSYFWSSTHYLPSSPGYPHAWYTKITSDLDPTLALPEHEFSDFPYVHGCYIRCVKD